MFNLCHRRLDTGGTSDQEVYSILIITLAVWMVPTYEEDKRSRTRFVF